MAADSLEIYPTITSGRVSIQPDYDTRKQIAVLAADVTSSFSLTRKGGNCQAWLQRLLALMTRNGLTESNISEVAKFIETDNVQKNRRSIQPR